MYQLAITRPGSLEPGIHKEITPRQAQLIRSVLEACERLEDADIEKLEDNISLSLYVFGADNPWGAGESVEASRG